MLILWIISAIIYLLVRLTDLEAVRFTPRAYLKFLAFMFFATIIRFVIFATLNDPKDMYVPFFTTLLPPFDLYMVWWEDVIFVLPSLVLFRKNLSRWFLIPLIMLSSLIFASGHLYQGSTWAIITLFYIPLMLHFAKKYGLATTAACHVTYDVVTYLTISAWIIAS